MSSPQRRGADMVIRNAAVYTLDPAKPWAQALAVRDGRILAVGDDSDVERLIDPATDVVDAAGAMVMPGLVDVHSHVGFGGQQAAWELVLSPAFTIDDILAAVHDRAVGLGPTSGSSAA